MAHAGLIMDDLPLDITPYAPPGVTERFTATEDGAFRRLLRYAWRQVPPCTLPDDAGVLAAVAGITTQQWSECSRLALTWTRGADGRLTLTQALAVKLAEATAAAALRETKRKASRARWDRPPDARAIHVQSMCNARASDAPSSEARARAERSALLRSSEQNRILRPLSAPGEEVIAQVGSARAQELGADFVRAWRTGQSARMLSAAIRDWQQRGYVAVALPAHKAGELATGQHAEPARVAAAVERVNAAIREGERNKSKRVRNAFALLVSLLGAQRAGGVPMEVDLYTRRRWDELEALAVRQAQADVSMQAARAKDPDGWASRLAKVERA